MYYYVLLCITMYYYVLLCITMYYYVLLCITMYYLIMTVRISGEYACASAFGYAPVRRISVCSQGSKRKDLYIGGVSADNNVEDLNINAHESGVRVGGKLFNSFAYADDISI